jgi:hypothetical protein
VGRRLDSAAINEVVLEVPWERHPLRPGPVGEYLEVMDLDPASGAWYAPVDLDHPHVLAEQGLTPSEGLPQFHQQMVYAVAMNTIRHFERALGRAALWSPRRIRDDSGRIVGEKPVPRLRVYPHALREANAYYSPEKKALLFGYFPAVGGARGEALPGGIVFTCLSHDVIAHETTHALVDGLHRRFVEASSPDVLAFHEAFADLVALFQHFSHPDVVVHQIQRTRGDLAGSESLLGQLAQEFGQATGGYGPLRDAIGGVGEDGVWRPATPDPTALARTWEPHARGSILVAAVFDAFLAIYRRRSADLLRIATGGSGALPQGTPSPDLAQRMAREASRSAEHVLQMCIRALDYCPPVDLTFGDYLRALVTADYDLVRDDDLRYRVAFIEAFRQWGIYPRDVRSLSEDSVRWEGPAGDLQERLDSLFADAGFLEEAGHAWDLGGDDRAGDDRGAGDSPGAGEAPAPAARRRDRMWQRSRMYAGLLHKYLAERLDARTMEDLGLQETGADGGERLPLEVHSVRPARRVGPDGQVLTELVIEITQRRRERDARDRPFWFRGGCTLLFDPATGRTRYIVFKRMASRSRLERERRFRSGDRTPSLRSTYFRDGHDAVREPFALLHRGAPGVGPAAAHRLGPGAPSASQGEGRETGAGGDR